MNSESYEAELLCAGTVQTSNIIIRVCVCRRMSTGYMGRVLKCGKEIELTGIPLLHLPQLTEMGVMREGGNEGEREGEAGRGRISCKERL